MPVSIRRQHRPERKKIRPIPPRRFRLADYRLSGPLLFPFRMGFESVPEPNRNRSKRGPVPSKTLLRRPLLQETRLLQQFQLEFPRFSRLYWIRNCYSFWFPDGCTPCVAKPAAFPFPPKNSFVFGNFAATIDWPRPILFVKYVNVGCLHVDRTRYTNHCKLKRLILNRLRWRLIADRNERPVYNSSSLSLPFDLAGMISLDRNYREKQ